MALTCDWFEAGHVWRRARRCPVPLSHFRLLSLHASDSVNSQRQHLGAGESLSGLRLSAVLLLVAPEVPTVPSVSVPVWREI